MQSNSALLNINEAEEIEDKVFLYDFVLDRHHNYLVTEHDIVVHNFLILTAPLASWVCGSCVFEFSVSLGLLGIAGLTKGLCDTLGFTKGDPAKNPPGWSDDWIRRRGGGWIDPDGNRWERDKGHVRPGEEHERNCPHWYVFGSNGGLKAEVGLDGAQLWPNGPKNKLR